MIIGVGIDVLQRDRINLEISKRVLSKEEMVVFNSFKNNDRKLEFLAGRFSVKEAIIKAIGNTNYKIGMRDITIQNDDLGMPSIKNPIYKDIKMHISLSHEIDYCVGMCVIESV